MILNYGGTMGLRCVDLFSGCGGMSLGFQNAGFEVVAAFDNWKPAVKVYEKNFKHPIYCTDINSDEARSLIASCAPEIIIGGPPCQDFSSAGHRNEKGGRAILSIKYSEIVADIRPLYFVMENVPQIRKSESIKLVRENFKKAGYGLSEIVLDASYCGVPQARKRFFMIGKLRAPDGFLDELLEKEKSDKRMTVHDYLGDSLGVEYYFRIPRSYNRRAIFSIYEPSVTVRGVDRPIPPNYKKHPKDPVDIGPEVRCLTPIERSYIQTFPKTFIFEGSKTDLNLMIGNAVPVNLASYVASAIKQYEEMTLDEMR